MVSILTVVDKLAVERGEKRNHIYLLTVTTGELMPALGIKPSPPHHRYVKTMVETHYPGTRAEALGYNGAQGFKLHIRIWSK